MKKIFLIVLLSVLLLSSLLVAQNKTSIMLKGGLVSPIGAYTGISGALQFSFPVAENIDLYISPEYSYWNRNKVNYPISSKYLDPNVVSPNSVRTYTEDDHNLTSVFFGSNYYFKDTEVFDAFLITELGLSYLSDKSYDLDLELEDGIFKDVHPVIKKQNSQVIAGFGLGMGVNRRITESFQLLLDLKINMFFDDSNYGMFQRGRTIYSGSAGFRFSI